MTQATTTKNGFNTVSQSGSGVTWAGLSNMPYPTEGEASAALTAGSQSANTIQLKVPYESTDIPVGSTFDEMTLYLTLKKTGTYSAATDVYWSGKFSLSTLTVWSYTMTDDETYKSITISGDKSYWRISSSYSLTQIIEKIKDGSGYFTVNGRTLTAVPCGVLVKSATCQITYTTVDGERASLIATIF